MGNLDETLSKRMKQLGVERQVEAAGVCETAQKEIAKYVSEDDFEVVSFKNGTLKIKVSSSSVSSEIFNNTKTLKNNIRGLSRIIVN